MAQRNEMLETLDSLLAKPSVLEAVDGVLNPDLPEATVVVPVYTNKAAGDRITMHWKAPTPEGSTDDGIRITDASKDRPSYFYVEAEYIKVNEGSRVEVSYVVHRPDGSDDSSEPLYITIGESKPEPGKVEPPDVEGVVDGVLNLASVSDQGANAAVRPYHGMALYDVVFIDINVNEWERAVQIDTPDKVGKPVQFVIPKSVLTGYTGQTIKLTTTVVPAKGDIFGSLPLPVRVLEPVGALPKPSVPLAEDDVLDPKKVTGATVEAIVKPYPDIAEGDVIHFTWENTSGVPAPFTHSATAPKDPEKDYPFQVPRAQVDQNIDGSARLWYVVTRGSVTSRPSDTLALWVGDAFLAPAKLDLTGRGYIVTDKLPPVVPEAFTYTRKAKFGQPPYTYKSGTPSVATVDNQGKVTAISNGTSIISATDSKNQSLAYTLTISGVLNLFFVSGSASFSGAQAACTAAGLRSITLDEMRQFWQLYYPSAGPVSAYQGWLGYPFWTATELGAGTAYAYDLNGASAQGNATGFDETEYMQVAGIAP
jgi:hypothetical protein